MVFYPLVIRGAVKSYRRKIGTLVVGEDGGKPVPVKDCPPTVDSLLRRPTMAVKKVSFRGWLFSPVPVDPHPYPSSRSSFSSCSADETLGETLSKMNSGDTLRDVFVRQGKRNRKGRSPTTSNNVEEPLDPNRSVDSVRSIPSSRNSRCLKGERVERIRRRQSNNSLYEDSLGSSSETVGTTRTMRNPSFHSLEMTAMPTKSCLLVRTQEESLALCVGADTDAEIVSSTPKGGNGPLKRLSRKRETSSGSGMVGSNHTCRSSELGTMRFGRIDSTGNNHLIRYGTIEIREYSASLGNHPACSEGPAISLGWSFRSHPELISVDEYERNRPPRKDMDKLIITKRRREKMLIKYGYSYDDIVQATAEKRYDQMCREKTLGRLKYEAFDERMEEFRSGNFFCRSARSL